MSAGAITNEEAVKFKRHSIILNNVLWRMLERLGEVDAEAMEHHDDPIKVIDRFFARFINPAPQQAQQPRHNGPCLQCGDAGVVDYDAEGFAVGMVPCPECPAPQQAEARAECTNRGRCDCIGECKHGRGGSGADGVPEGMALAYGYLWHAGNPSEVRGDNLVLPPEIAAAKARLELRGLLTTDQRCRAIDKVRAMLAAAQQPQQGGSPNV